MENPSRIVIDLSIYKTRQEGLDILNNILYYLMKSGHICTAVEEEVDIFAIQFNPLDEQLGYPIPYWLSPEEYEDFLIYKDSESRQDEADN